MQELIGRAPLPNPVRLTRLFLLKSHCLVFSTRDLKNFYYQCRTDPERTERQTWGPRVPADWFENLDDESLDCAPPGQEWWWPDLATMRSGAEEIACPAGYVQPGATVVLMGDQDAVFCAQEANVNVLT